MFFSDLRLEESVEFIVYDFGYILGAVGGSMGLFLGWSILDIVYRAAENIHKLAVRVSKKF